MQWRHNELSMTMIHEGYHRHSQDFVYGGALFSQKVYDLFSPPRCTA